MDSSKKQISFNPKYLKILSELASGSFGCVYNATYRNIPVVVKCSLQEEKKNDFLIQEYEFLNLLKKHKFPGIPKVSFRFVHEGRESFIMEKLGTDLQKLVKNTKEEKFSLETTLRMALQVLSALKCLHSCGIVHNDIKPNNLMVGRKNPGTIYLIDFGFASYYSNEGEHIGEAQVNQIRGTWKYCSVNSLNGRSLSRRDDLESLAYTLIRLRRGKLPWDELLRDKEMCKKAKRVKLVESKSASAESICEGLSGEFVTFLDEVRSLGFSEKPDYDKYHKMFEKLLLEKGFDANETIDWKI